ncbi:MAG: FecR family protein [Phormidesmis sp.]
MVQVRRLPLWILLVAPALGVCLGTLAYSQPISVRGDRWLTVTALSGKVDLTSYRSRQRQARLGDHLDRVGDMITTGSNASVSLNVDLATGSLTMSENSQLQVQALSITPAGGRVTELLVRRGQVRVRARPLTNPDTRLEIHTPAGVSGVRGTDFGVSVQPTGQTGVATIEGRVIASAQGQTVSVGTALQSSIYPGDPPTPPEPLRNDPTLYIERLTSSGTTVRIVGQTDLVNLLEIGDQPQVLSRAGRFDLSLPLPSDRRIEAMVTTPLGTQQKYQLVVP